MDMAHLAYITSASFRALALAHRRAKDCGTALALCGLNAIVNELFDLTGFSDSFEIYPNREAPVRFGQGDRLSAAWRVSSSPGSSRVPADRPRSPSVFR